MFIVAVVNLKGGCGKTTLATQLAARYARQGHPVVLADLDRQESALRWVARRPSELPLVEAVDLDADAMVLPFGEGRTVIDAPARLKRKHLEVVVRAADAVVVPLLPSAFDEDATARFVDAVREIGPVRKGRRPLLFVQNRVRARSLATRGLDAFCERAGIAPVARFSDAQHYVTAAATGRTLFDLPASREARLRREWAPLLDALDELAAAREESEAESG